MIDRRAVRVELRPTRAQAAALFSAATLSRKVYNWGLGRQRDHYETVVKPARERGEKGSILTVSQLSAEWTRVKDEIVSWNGEVPREVVTQALQDLDRAFANFFSTRSSGRRSGYPRFKSLDRTRPSFRVQTARHIEGKDIFLPRIHAVKTKEDPTERLVGVVTRMATISSVAGRWFISFNAEREIPDPVRKHGSVIGVDLGITIFAMCSDGKAIESPRPLLAASARLARLDHDIARGRNVAAGIGTARMKRRELQVAKAAGTHTWPTPAERKAARESRLAAKLAAEAAARASGTTTKANAHKSRRMKKRQERRARLHVQVTNQRGNFIHEVTTRLVRRHAVIKIESLRVLNMMKNHNLARSIVDQGWGQFTFQLNYKAELAGVTIIAAPTFFASTQLCSRCGIKNPTPLGQRIYRCACGLILNRDLNAARNLAQYQPAMAVGRGEAIRPERTSRHVSQNRVSTIQAISA